MLKNNTRINKFQKSFNCNQIQKNERYYHIPMLIKNEYIKHTWIINKILIYIETKCSKNYSWSTIHGVKNEPYGKTWHQLKNTKIWQEIPKIVIKYNKKYHKQLLSNISWIPPPVELNIKKALFLASRLSPLDFKFDENKTTK